MKSHSIIPRQLRRGNVRAAALMGLTAFLLTGCRAKTYSTDFFAMDTYMEMTVYGGSEKVLQQAEEEVLRLESLFDVTDPDSDIGRVNAAQGEYIMVSADTYELLENAKNMAERTGGALDPTIYPLVRSWGFTTDQYRVPGEDEIQSLLKQVDYTKLQLKDGTVCLPAGMEVDMGAVAKGYTGDRVLALLEDAGVDGALISLGGNIQAIGRKPDGSMWKIGIQDPAGDGCIGILSVEQGAVVTSGAYERFFTDEEGNTYGHILNPFTGKPVDNGLLSVTVVTEQGVYADALSTALFVMGADGARDYWQEQKDFDMVLVMENGQVLISPGISDNFELQGTEYTLECLEE